MEDQIVKECFNFMSKETKKYCWKSEVGEIDGCPDALTFLRDWVSPNHPLICRNAFPSWTKWTSSYLREKMGQNKVSVAVTPNGYADAIYNDMFVIPEQRCMLLSTFLDIMEHPEKESGIFYIQKQDSNLKTEFPELLKEFGSEIPWASLAFGNKPDAINFWMGDERATTSMHRDYYENIYIVISGWKDFILHPPTDLPWIPYQNFQVGTHYQRKNKEWTVEHLPQTPVPWICVDPLKPDYEMFPWYKKVHTIRCRVEAGDALYLPSLWFHHVQQSHGCIAVNYWYDMCFDIKYVNYKLLEMLKNVRKHYDGGLNNPET